LQPLVFQAPGAQTPQLRADWPGQTTTTPVSRWEDVAAWPRAGGTTPAAGWRSPLALWRRSTRRPLFGPARSYRGPTGLTSTDSGASRLPHRPGPVGM